MSGFTQLPGTHPEPEKVTLVQKLDNLSDALDKLWKSGFKRVPDEVSEQRKAICKTCYFWKPEGNFGLGKCEKCGCSYLKQLFSSLACPVGNWKVYNG